MNAKNITLSLLLIIANVINCNTSDLYQLQKEVLSAAELERIAQVESLVQKIKTSTEMRNLASAEYNLNQHYREFYNARQNYLENGNCHMSAELKEALDAFSKAGIEYAQAVKNMDESDCKKVDAEALLQLMKQQQLS
jgi:ribosome biogenesis GTPase A